MGRFSKVLSRIKKPRAKRVRVAKAVQSIASTKAIKTVIQDDFIVFAWEIGGGGHQTDSLSRLPGEADVTFVTRIVAKMSSLSADNSGAIIYVYTAVVGGNITINPLAILEIEPSFIDELLGGP